MLNQIPAGQLATLSYRSKASTSFSADDLEPLVDVARSRNASSSVTGLLVYDDGRFFQWLEGPPQSVRSIWSLIRQDRRHTDIELLEYSASSARMFGDWGLKLATRNSRAQVSANHPVVVPPEIVPSLVRSPEAASAFIAAMPRREREASASSLMQSPTGVSVRRPKPRARLPLAHARAAELARLLTCVDPADALALLDLLTAEAGSIEAACAAVSEPAARSLGELWARDDCAEVDVVLGLGRLRTAVHRTHFDVELESTYGAPFGAVLVVPQPGEKHVIGAALDAEVLCRSGFDPQCEFPQTNEALNALVSNRWFDAIDLSLSTAFRRDDWLDRMAQTIALARRASMNPEIVVVVGGRIFYEQGAVASTVGADQDNRSALDVAQSIRQSLRD